MAELGVTTNEKTPQEAGLPRPLAAIGFAVLLFLASQVVASLVLIAVLSALGWSTDRTFDWLGSATLGQFLFIAITEAITISGIVWLLKRRGLTMRAIGWDVPKWRFLWLAVLGFGVYFIGYIVIATVTSLLIPSLNFEQEQEIGFKNSTTNLQLLLTFVSLVVLPPITEEIVFRGWLFSSIRKKLPFLLTTLIVSVLFAIPHLQFGSNAPLLWVAALDTLILSFVLCYVREKTGSLWPSIFIHALKNGIAFTVLFVLA